MSFDALESSVQGGRPIDLHLFELGTTRFAYCNRERAVTYDSIEYAPQVGISRGRIAAERERESQDIQVIVPSSNPFASLFSGDPPPGERPTYTLRQAHHGDGEAVVAFSGRVASVSRTRSLREAVITVRPLTAGAGSRLLPRHTYHASCGHFLFDARCKLLEADWEEFPTVTGVAGRAITVTGATNVGGGSDYWVSGTIQRGEELRLVVSQAANVLTLNAPFRVSPLSQTVRALPGCKLRRVEDCHTKFNNAINYGGTDHVSDKNLFETGIE